MARQARRKPPVISFNSANRTDASDASSQPATRAGSAALGAVSRVLTTSDKAGGAALVAAGGHISATVSARSPT